MELNIELVGSKYLMHISPSQLLSVPCRKEHMTTSQDIFSIVHTHTNHGTNLCSPDLSLKKDAKKRLFHFFLQDQETF